MALGSDKRKHKRIGVSWTGQALDEFGPPANVEIVNISETGLGVVSLSPMKPSARFRFKLQGWTEAPLEGIVRWVEVGDIQTYAGIEFVTPTRKQQIALRELIGRYDREDWGG